MSTGKKRYKWLLPFAALAIALLCELLIFNLKPLFSLGRTWTPLPEPELQGDFASGETLSLNYWELNREIQWGHFLIEVRDGKGQIVSTELSVLYSDEGHRDLYEAGKISYVPSHDKGSYFRLNAYGKVRGLQLRLASPGEGASYTLQAAEINGSVPFRISVIRIAGIFALLLLLYALRPSSVLYDNRVWNRRRWTKAACVLLILILEFGALLSLAKSNQTLVQIPDQPNWLHHHQYARLARALAEGKTYIDGPEHENALKLLAELKNPFDTSARKALFRQNNEIYPWDTAYYDGHFYVYFGVVPVLLSYLPYYLLTGNDLSTVWVAVISAFFVVLTAFLCMRALIRRFFPRTPFSVYVLISLLLGNATAVLFFAVDPCFYIVPVYFSLSFVFLALALWLSAAARWDRTKGRGAEPQQPELLCFAQLPPEPRSAGIGLRIALGSLFAALVAGCRPQYLVFSALALPIFWPLIRKERGAVTFRRLLLFALPYAAVAAPLMYYNNIRFGSPFDFGANYNLTTNDMPHRGWNLARLPDGFFAYLFRTPDLRLQFPYVFPASTNPVYIGKTISEPMFGSVLLISPFLWTLLFLRRARQGLREKRLWLLTLLPLLLCLIVIAADTEMAGILWRYTTDFLALLYLSAAIIYLERLERAAPDGRKKWIRFLVAAAVLTALLCFLISLTSSNLVNRSTQVYFRLKDLLSWG